MKKITLLFTIFISMNISGQNNNILNEKWKLKTNGNEAVEIEFLPDYTFKASGKYSNKWHTNAEGTYYYQPESNEIFVAVDHASLDWLYQIKPELYWAELYSDYQLYFRIIDKNSSGITAEEYINSYHEDIPESSSYYDKEPVWENKDGKYSLIADIKSRLKEKKYIIADNGLPE